MPAPFSRLELPAAATSPDWTAPPAGPAPGENEVHLWRCPLERAAAAPAAAEFFALLSAGERARAGRFYFAENRRRYIVGRGWLRVVLGGYLHAEPAALVFRYGARGKPYLFAPRGGTPVCFNVAHDDGLVLVAVARGHAVGVDVERVQPVADADAVAARFFSPRERRELAASPQGARAETFLRFWTAKEACAKAVGCGLDENLRQVDVAGADHRAARGATLVDETDRPAHCWLANFSVPSDHIAAVALVGEGAEEAWAEGE